MKTTRKIISFFLAFCMLMTCMPNNMVYVSAASSFSGGSGTEDDPYILKNAADFKQLATDVNGGTSYEGKYFKVSDQVTEPIALSTDGGFVPIGTVLNGNDFRYFGGVFDGNGKTIDLNLSGTEHVGLFGYLGSGAVIKNITTTGTVTGSNNVGSIAGYCNGGSNDGVINCHNQATVTGAQYVGGIVGYTTYGNIINCSNTGSVNTSSQYGGGITGFMTGTGRVINCLNKGTVAASSYTGGIIGYAYGSGSILNSVNYGTSKGGGIAGKLYSTVTVTNSYYNQTVNAGVCDGGSDEDNKQITSTNCAKSGEELRGEAVLYELNYYAERNTPINTALLYWKAAGDSITFTTERPSTIPYQITNESTEYLTIQKEEAVINDTVTVSANAPDCFLVTEITVTDSSGNTIETNQSGKNYTFTMPGSNVNVSAKTDINLTMVDGVYQINSADDMKILAKAVNSGYSTSDKKFTLTEDVSLSSEDGFIPIGNNNNKNRFRGSFDGGNHTVSLSLDSSDTSFMGLFGYCDSGSLIKNITITGTIKGDYYVGGIVGRMSDGQIINCQNEADVSGNRYVGGMIGQFFTNSTEINSKAINCLNTGSVTGNQDTGGIIGKIGISTDLYNCVNNGVVNKTDGSTYPVGGMIGTVASVTGYSCTNCYYNETKNSGIYDIGKVFGGSILTDKKYAVSGDEIVSKNIINKLNCYVEDYNTSGDTKCLYWKTDGENILLTEEVQSIEFAITNHSSDCLDVVNHANNGEKVTVTVKDLSYMSVNGITVTDTDNQEIPVTKTDTGYTFTMPLNDVTISAKTDIKFDQTDGVYQLKSAKDMNILAEAVNNGYDTEGRKFVLTSDVSLSTGEGFAPIGTEENIFKGIFDGGNHTVSLNLTAGEADYVGLFGYTGQDSVIRNVTIAGKVNGKAYVGGIVGYSLGSVINCNNKADISGEGNVGGLVGKLESAKIRNCLNSGSVTGEKDTGGMAGNVVSAELSNCFNNGSVIKADNSQYKVGGIAGRIDQSAVITNCYYNESLNEGIFDAGYDETDTEITEKEYAVSGNANILKMVVYELNIYVNDVNASSTDQKLLYWEMVDDAVSLTEVYQKKPLNINNTSVQFISVDRYALAGDEVAVFVDKSGYLSACAITVKDASGNIISTTKTNEGYTFTMPESDVTVSATTDINLTQTDGVYQIGSAREMKILSDAIHNGYNTDEKSFKLTSDVSLSTEEGFAPIGTDSNPFKGSFDGNCNTVALNIDLSGTDDVGEAGLFGVCDSYAVIKNVKTTGTVNGKNCVGGIVGYLKEGYIISCHNGVDVTGVTDVGGIAGRMISGTEVVNCLNSGSVTGGKSTGGIAGESSYLTNCVNNGEVKKAAGSDYAVGGITGMLGLSESLSNCYYNETINEGMKDAGYDADENLFTDKSCAVSGTDIVSDTLIGGLNIYADSNSNKIANTELLYWKADGNNLALTSEKPVIPHTITNHSDYITVVGNAKAGTTVTIADNVPDYLAVTGVTVQDETGTDVKTTETDTGYTFTMPESDVTVSATTDINLTQTEGVYQIGSAREMKILSDAVSNEYETYTKIFKLTSDVSLSTGEGFAPIGTDSHPFYGTFDGNGKTVALNIDLSGTEDVGEAGLFGVCDSGSVIKNVKTTGTVNGKNCVGGIVGYLNAGDIINCHNGADVTGVTYVGGIAGRMVNGADGVNCLNSGSVTGEKSTGGIAGESSYLTNCVNNGEVKKAAGSDYAVGGIAGMLGLSESLSNCYYNETINEGMKDAGYDADENLFTDKSCAVSGTDIVSDAVMDKLNIYVVEKMVEDMALLYWKADNSTISLTSEKQPIPYAITNYSKYINIAKSAKPGERVEITAADIPSYEKLVNITVNGEELAADTEGRYVFTMPEKDVTVDAEVTLALTQLEDDTYAISTAGELRLFAMAVNSGYYNAAEVTLTEDITASSEDGFVPIGTFDNPFCGSFYGDGHTLTLDITEGLDDDGTTVTSLFGVVEGAHIYDLILKGSVDGGDKTDSYTGALLGVADNSNTYVYNVYSEVAVCGSGYVGGIVGNGKNKKARLRNVVHNGTVTQKNTAEDKLAVGAVMGRGNTKYTNVYYNSEKNSGMYYCGYDDDDFEVTSDDASVKAKTTAALFSDEVMDELNLYALDDGDLMFWDISADTKSVKLVKNCPAPLYEISPANGLSGQCITVPEYSRAGKTITVNTKVDAAYEGIIKSITGIKVTDSRGNVIDVSKTADDTYEFVMPKQNVSIQVLLECDIDTDANGVYCIENAKDLLRFAYIVEGGQPDANAKVTAETIDVNDELTGVDTSLSDGLIGSNTAYRGEFDGNGATITWSGTLFGKTDGAVIKNLNISTVVKGANLAGVVNTAKDSVITNCSVTASGSAEYFGGIVFSTQGNTVIANCVLNESDLGADFYGGIVCIARGETEIYNCVNQDLFTSEETINDAGMIVEDAELSGLTLTNNFYYKDAGLYYDVDYDAEEGDYIRAMTDENSAVDEEKVGARYIPAKLNEYIEGHPDFIEGTEFNKWSAGYNDETGKDVICFADASHPEVYSIKKSGIPVNTLVKEKNSYGAVSGAAVTVSGVPTDGAVTVIDENGSDITLIANSDTCVFTMPEGDVTVSVTMDSGIEETTEIDGETYVVVKNADDFIKAVTSIAAGNSVLNVSLGEDITLKAEDLEKYPAYTETTPAYNGTFDGAGHKVTFEGAATSILAIIGEKGLVKNLTVNGTNRSETGAAAVAQINNGTIMNCINKVKISGQMAAGIVSSNQGTICNCINKGDMTGSQYAAAIAITNGGKVSCVANEGTISSGTSGQSKMITLGNDAETALDLSNETDSSVWAENAAKLNDALEKGKVDISLPDDCREWSVSETDTDVELVFADEVNAPYYMCSTPDGDKPYQAGSTVEVTFDSSDLEEGFVIAGAKVQAVYSDEKFDATPVSGKDDTFSFTMPRKTCKVERNVEADGLEKDEDGCYLVGTLDDLLKVKKTIESCNNGINIKLTADIEGYDGSPIGGSGGYSGIFDGDGHSITLAMSDDSGDYQYYGLFGTLNSSAVVKNLTIKGSMEANDSGYAGAVAGKSYGTVTDCVNNAVVTNNTNNSGYAGGIVGCSEGVKKSPAKLSNCVNNGDVIGYDAGGIVADIENYSVITNCENSGAVTAIDDAGGIVAQGINVEIINCINTGAVSGDCAGGIVGYGCDTITIKNCFNSENVTGDDVYAIACYGSDSGSDGKILNSFYLQTEDINAGLSSSKFTNEQDSSEAVTEAEVRSGYVAYRLRSGQAEDETVFWGQTLSGDNPDARPVLGGEKVYRNETYKGCAGNPGNPTYFYSNKQEEKVYAAHDYVNGVCNVCDAIWEETINGITYQAITEEVDGKPIGKLVTVSGKVQVAVRVTGTGEDFSESISDDKVTIPSEVTGSDTEQTFVVTEISKNAFSGADVTEIVVPDTITEVGTGAFGEAETITFRGTEPPAGIKDALSPNATVNVPEGAKDSYLEAIDENANIVEAHTHIKGEGTRVEPTCEKKGSITYKCTKCGEVLEVVELDATGHTWDEGKVTKEATETEEGEKTYTCIVCGKTKTEAIPKKEAEPSASATPEPSASATPEPSASATPEPSASVTPEPSASATPEPSASVTPVSIKNGVVVLDDKGAAKVKVTEVKKKEVEYKEPGNKKAKTVSIPATVKIDGVIYKVTKIGDNAFKNNKTVTKVTVGSNIKTIGKNAFYKCTKLKTVKIGKNVTKIGANAFKGCKKLKTIKITSTKLTSKTVSKNAFKGLTKATTIKVPKKKLSAYKKLFKQKGLSSKVKVKGY